MTVFNGRRFLKFLRFEFAISRSKVLMPLAVPALLYAFWALSRFTFAGRIDSWGQFSFTIGLLLAVDVAATAFRRDLTPESAGVHLLLPSSHLERFLARWCLSFVLAFVAQLIVLTVVANLFVLLQWAFTAEGFTGWLLPDVTLLQRSLRNFILVHAIFFTGGLYFRKQPVFKAVFAAAGYIAACAFVAFLLSIAGYKFMKGDGLSIVNSAIGILANDDLFSSMAVFVPWFIIMPALLYLSAYFLVQEIEANG